MTPKTPPVAPSVVPPTVSEAKSLRGIAIVFGLGGTLAVVVAGMGGWGFEMLPIALGVLILAHSFMSPPVNGREKAVRAVLTVGLVVYVAAVLLEFRATARLPVRAPGNVPAVAPTES